MRSLQRRFQRLSHVLAMSLLAVLVSACATQRSPSQVDSVLRSALRSASELHASGMDPEATLIVKAVAAVDPDYPGLEELDAFLDPAFREHWERGYLGMNKRLRPQVERSFAKQALLYLPDRILDLLDVFTLGAHLGLGFYGDHHVTRGLQLAWGARATGGAGLHDNRSLGFKSQSEGGLTVISSGGHTWAQALMGTSGIHGFAGDTLGAHRPTDLIYQEARDYWAVGMSVTGFILGFEADLHPVQLADFFAGWVGIDFLNDDWAKTRNLRLNRTDQRMLAELWQVRGDEDTLTAYHDARKAGKVGHGAWFEPDTDLPASPEKKR